MMKPFLLSALSTALLAGCATSLPYDPLQLQQTGQYAGGETAGDTTSFYWYSERQNAPVSASDYVVSQRFGWYQSSYRWDEGELREVIREGMQPKARQLVPYRVQIRFDKNGDAIYQHYRVDGKVLPLNQNQLARYQQQAGELTGKIRQQHSQGLTLVQGIWDGEVFESCSGIDYRHLEFNQTLPDFVVNRLSSLDSYVAFLGSAEKDTVRIETILTLDDDSHDCIKRPALIDSQE